MRQLISGLKPTGMARHHVTSKEGGIVPTKEVVILGRPYLRRFAAVVPLLVAASLSRPARADDLNAAHHRRFDVDDYRQVQSLTLPDPVGPGDVQSDGRIVVLSDATLFRETAPRSRTFVALGTLPNADFSTFGASFLKISPDGRTIAVGNNGGASFDHFQVGVFSFPALNGAWFDVNSFEAAWVSDRFLALTAGVFGTPSIVTVFDTRSTDPAHPLNRTVIDNIGGASGGIAFDTEHNLYTANGFATAGPSQTGEIKAFRPRDWIGAFFSGTPIDFETHGTEIVTVLSAAPLEFDRSGNLLVGGGDFFGGGDINFAALIDARAVRAALFGHGPIDATDPAQVRRVDPDPADGSMYNIVVNRALDEIYLTSTFTGTGATAFVFRAR